MFIFILTFLQVVKIVQFRHFPLVGRRLLKHRVVQRQKESDFSKEVDTIVQSDYLAVITSNEREIDMASQSMFAILMKLILFLRNPPVSKCLAIVYETQ